MVKGLSHKLAALYRLICKCTEVTLWTVLVFVAIDQGIRLAGPNWMWPKPYDNIDVHRVPTPYIEIQGHAVQRA